MTPWAAFCLFFWIGAVVTLGLAFAAANPLWLIAPAACAALGRWTGYRAAHPDFTTDFYTETFDETD